MSVLENADVKVDSSGHNLDKNIVSPPQTKPPCPDDQNPKRQTNEVNLKIEISHLDDKFSKLNPMAKEFVPPSLAYSASLRNGLWFTNNFAMQAISSANGVNIYILYIFFGCDLYICVVFVFEFVVFHEMSA